MEQRLSKSWSVRGFKIASLTPISKCTCHGGVLLGVLRTVARTVSAGNIRPKKYRATSPLLRRRELWLTLEVALDPLREFRHFLGVVFRTR